MNLKADIKYNLDFRRKLQPKRICHGLTDAMEMELEIEENMKDFRKKCAAELAREGPNKYEEKIQRLFAWVESRRAEAAETKQQDQMSEEFSPDFDSDADFLSRMPIEVILVEPEIDQQVKPSNMSRSLRVKKRVDYNVIENNNDLDDMMDDASLRVPYRRRGFVYPAASTAAPIAIVPTTSSALAADSLKEVGMFDEIDVGDMKNLKGLLLI